MAATTTTSLRYEYSDGTKSRKETVSNVTNDVSTEKAKTFGEALSTYLNGEYDLENICKITTTEEYLEI